MKSFLNRLGKKDVFFVLGVIGVIHETWWSNLDRPNLLILYAAMMGIPLLLRANGK